MSRPLWVATLLISLVLSLVMSACERPGQSDSSARSIRPVSGSRSKSDADGPIPITSGRASISCDYDYEARTDVSLSHVSHEALTQAVARCAATNMVHVYYSGTVAADFLAFITALNQVTNEKSMAVKILDLDSSGGDVEIAMRAGDVIAGSSWGLWISKQSSCLSACVLILAASSYRSVSGSVGVHRLFPTASSATTRADLDTELKDIVEAVRAYLRKHGASASVADLMMTVPANDIRLLTSNEIGQFGLDGTNAAQADLDRIQLVKKCGIEFVERKEAWGRALRQCRSASDSSLRQFDECATRLSKQFGFPDARCPEDGPVSLFGS